MRRHRVPMLMGAIAFALFGIATAAPQDAEQRVLTHLQMNKQQYGVTGADLGDVVVASSFTSDHNGLTHVYLQQRHRGIDVWSGIFNASIAADGTVVHSGNRFVARLAASAGGQNARKSGAEAAKAAAGHLKLKASKPFEVLQRKGGPDERMTLSDGGVAARPIPARLVWYPLDDGQVRLAWELEIEEAGGDNWWQTLIDAESGALLAQHNLVIHDAVDAIAGALARPDGSSSAINSQGGTDQTLALLANLPQFPTTDGASYRVFPIPLESPGDGADVLVANAADPVGSPLGWHDTGTTAYTITRGNNAHAYADRDANNVADPGSDPSGGALLIFDFPYDQSAAPVVSQPAAVTNLFYWNNVMHDVTYRYGFTEAAGNFQVNNFGNGGSGNDDVRAEAQDGSGVNNANFSTPADGSRPRMQMFEWVNSLPARLIIEGSPIAGEYAGPPAGFGPTLAETGPVTGTVVLVDDGVVNDFPATGTTNDGCSAFSVPNGAIALLARGSCPFIDKVRNAQNGGAAAVIVSNNIAGDAISMGCTANCAVTIPSMMVTLGTGDLFRANLPFTATLADGSMGLPDRDSDFDAGVIAHEYGHGISNRLTGGRTLVNCLSNAEQMGEGWSDWFGITLTAHPADTRSTRRGVGTYVSFQPGNGRGIRPTPYSTDMGVNPSTYASVADAVNISSPHGIGYVWNTMLWEMYWNLIDRHGFNANIYDAWHSGGNNLAMQLVMDGMKLQVCRPGFVDGRNAILAADVALTNGANQCEIWRGFAKRGLGFSASQGLSSSRSDGVEAFDLPAACTTASFGRFLAPIAAAPGINKAKAGASVPVKFTLAGGPAAQIDTQPVNCATLEATGEAPKTLVSPGTSGTEVDGDLYQINWKTDKAWAGTCRRLSVRIPASADAHAYFQF